MKKLLLGTWILAIMSGICYLFWHEDWKYSLPTPVPQGYKPVKPGSLIMLEGKIKSNNKPLFLHFFNPDCPCSKFNIPHFRSLVRKYGDKISFAAVIISKDRSHSAEWIREKFGVDVPVLFDASIADSCGVYSTPQAVLIDKDHRLYYRGNYNKSRYCADKNTNYAQMAVDSLLGNHLAYKADKVALKSYGCSLPACNIK